MCECSQGKQECDCGLCYVPEGRVVTPGVDVISPLSDKDTLWVCVWLMLCALVGFAGLAMALD